ncbi:thioesterase-like superfamily-domain-containing protein [Lasiosphaeria miniovina]|uniref:Thioesterase-like superfamily-domain-containing protein n=1 Tax=Lasiosphaeria miniovina TaxID=1954250 RepID=A0AA40B4N5_9PEZI|nr:thioesterase-like superfamily-domain-containing protein [Lasiosphaeria miniovina]KAK0727472.1 thioesterase-like superfamily-domain-containing protein [Lasiosphaeria miniovina]
MAHSSPNHLVARPGSSALRFLVCRPSPPASRSQFLSSLPFAVRLSSSRATDSSSSSLPPPPPPSRWITELRARVGKCISFGCDNQQISRAAAVARAIALEWRDLLAGSEGFLTGGRRGLDRHKIAWGEMDSFGHVNNVNYYRYAESARVNWITNFAVHVDPAHRSEWSELMSPKATGLIMRSLKANFKFVGACLKPAPLCTSPMVYPDNISVYHKLRTKPERDAAPSAFMLDCVILSHQHRRIAARLEEDIVIYDYKAARKASMPPFMLDLFAETYKLQVEETARARGRIWDLIAAVERLEKETWDREDAVEDMGSLKGAHKV